uniref:Uncharacterized protein n=1 Tax=Lactuca sativa TaxID=4236 RepID=A0A9R1UW85_LACSA|nr:hypothetical protein LSAT_V11C700364690 [Lactuca sativa]
MLLSRLLMAGPFLTKSPMGGCPTSHSASNGIPSKVGPSSSGAYGLYLPGWNLTPNSLLSEKSPTSEWCHHAFPSATSSRRGSGTSRRSCTSSMNATLCYLERRLLLRLRWRLWTGRSTTYLSKSKIWQRRRLD